MQIRPFIFIALMLCISGISALAELPAKRPVVLIVSGGFGTCANGKQLRMAGYLQEFAAQAEATGHPVKFIYTCFSRLGPTEDLEAFSVIPGQPPSPVRVFKGGKNYYQNIQTFLHSYLPSEIPPNAFVADIGQSHGGWLALEITASRRVDFLGELDGVNRTDCNFRKVISVQMIRRIKAGICSTAGRPELIMAAINSLAANHGTGVNIVENASITHSSPLGLPPVKDIDFARLNPFYSNRGKGPTLNEKAHQALAEDPYAWKLLLTELNRKMAAEDPDWTIPRETALASGRPHAQPFVSTH